MLCICALFMCVCVFVCISLCIFEENYSSVFCLFANMLSRLYVSVGLDHFLYFAPNKKSSVNLWILNGNTYFYVLLFHFFFV
jgi:hypothetical protein